MAKSKKKSTFAKARRKKKRATIRNPIKVVRRKLSSSKKTNGKKQTVKTRAVGIARDKKDKEVFKGIGIVVEETDEAVIIKKKKREKAAEKAQDTKDSLTLVGTEVPQVPEGLYQPQAIMYFPKEEIEKMHESRAEPGKTRDEEKIARQETLKQWLESGGTKGDFLEIDRPPKKKPSKKKKS